MLSNAYFLAKIRFATAENEPAKNLQNVANFPNFANPNPPVDRGDWFRGAFFRRSQKGKRRTSASISGSGGFPDFRFTMRENIPPRRVASASPSSSPFS